MLARVRANRYFAALLATGAGVLVIPGLAWAGSGGAGAGPASGTNPNVQSGAGTVSATGDGITISSAASAFVRSGVSVSGTVPASDAGASVEIDQLPATPGSTWVPVAVVPAASDGTFTATWHTKGAGQLTIRAVLGGNQASTAASSPPALSVTVYKRSIATLYGPGFWGHKTACGVTLRRRTIGVANRTLPCGTEVEVYYKGSVMTVPVIDRGPYAHHANWDITMATARALGMTGTAVVGAASVPIAPSTSGSAPSGAPAAQ
ncbi:MAG TPA: septal ring lytic transglycosylase RlpA family protein [Solirubrobacteraceae bacterium]|nr:septal ring lytic transglycosylase RlpA family protein [Solirubrobacteraceae bacterium]